MPDNLSDARYQVALANRILANEGVLDAFGHVSLRHPNDPGRYLLARSRSPGLIEPADVLEFALDSEPVAPPRVPLYAERVIHGCIYQARPDVTAVCHHHAPAVMPFCITGVPIVPVFQLGAAAGNAMPNVTNRTWEYWTLRLGRTAGLPPVSKARPQAASVTRSRSPKTRARGERKR